MSMIDNAHSTAPADSAKPLDAFAYRAAVYNAAASVPCRKDGTRHKPRLVNLTLEEVEPLHSEIRDLVERLAADHEGKVLALLNQFEPTPIAAEWMLMFVMTAVNRAANRHEVKSRLSDAASLCSEQADAIDGVLTALPNQPGVGVLPAQREALKELAASLRYQAEHRKSSLARFSQKLDASSAAVMAAAREIHHYAHEGFLPKLKATEIAVLLSVAMGRDVPKHIIREALRGLGDSSLPKNQKSRSKKTQVNSCKLFKFVGA